MGRLSCRDYAQALRLLSRLEASCGDPRTFSRQAARALTEFVPSDLALLDLWRLPATGSAEPLPLAARPPDRRQVLDLPCPEVSERCERGDGSLHALALTVPLDARTQMRIVVQRRGKGFTGREQEKLELLGPHLAFLQRLSCHRHDSPRADQEASCTTAGPLLRGLTPREADVLRWLASGKTDKDIATLLGLSPRTVHKHLEHIYAKLGVETRTAAVMRAAALELRQQGPLFLQG